MFIPLNASIPDYLHSQTILSGDKHAVIAASRTSQAGKRCLPGKEYLVGRVDISNLLVPT
jgi:hypothetical protein